MSKNNGTETVNFGTSGIGDLPAQGGSRAPPGTREYLAVLEKETPSELVGSIYRRLSCIFGAMPSPSPHTDERSGLGDKGGSSSRTASGRPKPEAGPRAHTVSRLWQRATKTVSRIANPAEGFKFLSRLSEAESAYARAVAVSLLRKFPDVDAYPLGSAKSLKGDIFSWGQSFMNMSNEPSDRSLRLEAKHLILCYKASVKLSILQMFTEVSGGADGFFSALRWEPWTDESTAHYDIPLDEDDFKIQLLPRRTTMPGDTGFCSMCNV